MRLHFPILFLCRRTLLGIGNGLGIDRWSWHIYIPSVLSPVLIPVYTRSLIPSMTLELGNSCN